MEIIINIVEIAKELAEQRIEDTVLGDYEDILEIDENEELVYTEEGQSMFDSFYDMYYDMLYSAQIKSDN